MAQPKRVAIIGAGPSGLVMAKTLLQNFPPGTFSPVIFEKKRRIGGLWAVDYPPDTSSLDSDTPPTPPPSTRSKSRNRGFVDPWMRTNLSRFSVAFSDLAWETALGGRGVPVFPCAWEVRKYLEKYAEVYVPGGCLRLGRRVLQAARREKGGLGSGVRWEVSSVDDSEFDDGLAHDLSDSRVHTEEFDFLVVASGHFGTPNIPHIPGFENFPRTVHSSELQDAEDVRRLLEMSPKGGKLVVVGGSMSGVEAATLLALHLSSVNFKPGSSARGRNAFEVWHVGTGPFWVLPTYLPHQCTGGSSKDSAVPFVPLDLSLYDLSRRPPGMTELAFGPVSPDQVSKRHQFFRDMLGKDYSKIGGINLTDDQGKEDSERPPWVGIANYYAEFVRSGAIKILTGRACSVTHSEPGLGAINVQTSAGMTPVNEVAAIVVATGFKPSNSLAFLPQDVLSTLEYSKEDHFLPLILDTLSTAHSEVPDLGFVGFYRGAFWGPAELQAQSLAQTWATVDLESTVPISLSAEEQLSRAIERQRVRDLRNTRPITRRGQFPLGDYVGLMGSLSGRVKRPRLPLEIDPSTGVQLVGPVVPARYPPVSVDGDPEGSKRPAQKEVEITMKALNGTLLAEPDRSCVGTAAAIFRALHGQWTFERVAAARVDEGKEVRSSGKTTFHPRYLSCPDYEAEYLSEEINDNDPSITVKSVYRLRDTSRWPKQAGIRVWSVNDKGPCPNSATELVLELHVGPVGKVFDSGGILVEAGDSGDSRLARHTYEFYFDRVAITSWCHHMVCPSKEGDSVSQYTTRYSRPTDT